jgi:hypothetical protein
MELCSALCTQRKTGDTVSHTSSTNRQHTIIVSQRDGLITGVILEKDWFSYEWTQLSDWHHRVRRSQGLFHVVGNDPEIALATSEILVDRCCEGKIRVIDLRQYSISDLLSKKTDRKTKK